MGVSSAGAVHGGGLHVAGIAELHDCSNSREEEPEAISSTEGNIRHFQWDASICDSLPRVYADGSSAYNSKGKFMAGAGIYSEDGGFSLSVNLGEVTSQYAELATALIAIVMCRDRGIKDLVLGTVCL